MSTDVLNKNNELPPAICGNMTFREKIFNKIFSIKYYVATNDTSLSQCCLAFSKFVQMLMLPQAEENMIEACVIYTAKYFS